jgi:hypothetical protein
MTLSDMNLHSNSNQNATWVMTFLPHPTSTLQTQINEITSPTEQEDECAPVYTLQRNLYI